MTKPQRPTVDELVSELRLLIFEFIWPTFKWIQGIWIKESRGAFIVFTQVHAMPKKISVERFEYVMREMFNESEEPRDELEPKSKDAIRFTVEYGPEVPKDRGYQELMSDRVFRMIAKRHAPSRLTIGR